MANKMGLVIGLGIGYVLGARAGRERYEQIRAALWRLRDTPVVARPLDAAGERIAGAVRAEGMRITDTVADSVRDRLLGARRREEYVDVEVEEID
ncbi:MAG: YtxH domain-containing protein [Actinomyces sp.]|jgi:hypothetical protein|uniref:YtxH domain-containing protein n=1 Tax=Schaalia naturae TaxID=635203 RepID=A0ABW2SQD4_9ACTO|nr:YtxH domain-containing protein [Actinomyces sp.]MCI1691965.1 YtxH domain-containing protein [Actinomyces sp.]MCI1788593.1 YtxH domain-containing protein [Actinomyces sp.]MCI1830248.1 YtxH domain-containing protein [Actinomyces sp.]